MSRHFWRKSEDKLMKKNGHLPRSVSKKLVERAARGEKVSLVVNRNGQPSRVFGWDECLKIKNLPHQVKPWEHRKGQEEVPDPLGAVDMGQLLTPLTREALYEE
jgi:hypothetical protein